MSGIVLSASVRQNLLSLQSTAQLLATTQNRLSTGNKVNSALDNPTNFFTAAGLDNRANDIGALLDGIGNGVQVLQAANTGLTSLQKLVDSAKSVANQALQTTVAYSAKSTVTTAAIEGATASNLLGTTYTAASAVGTNNTAKDASALTFASTLSGAAGSDSVATNFVAGDQIIVNGVTIRFNSGEGTTGSATAGTLSIDVTVGDVQDVVDAIDDITGTSVAATINGTGAITLNTGTTSDLTLSGTGVAKLNLAAGTTERTVSGTVLGSKTLSIAATGGGTAVDITFGTSAGQVDTLDELNAALIGNNLQATIATNGSLTITTTNDAASATIGGIGGSAAVSGEPFYNLVGNAPTLNDAAQLTRANLVVQYNDIITQITTTAQDASFNGVNLLYGDQLKLVFNETGTSVLNISGVVFDSGGLGLATLQKGTDFVDNNKTKLVLDSLNTASSTLRSHASALGSNLSIVQIRQDFSKNLINVLQTGSSNLTIADTNEEAANSQALSTRQSIAVSALALANQSNQSVLKLLQ